MNFMKSKKEKRKKCNFKKSNFEKKEQSLASWNFSRKFSWKVRERRSRTNYSCILFLHISKASYQRQTVLPRMCRAEGIKVRRESGDNHEYRKKGLLKDSLEGESHWWNEMVGLVARLKCRGGNLLHECQILNKWSRRQIWTYCSWIQT